MATSTIRLRMTEDDLKDIKPDSPLYKRAAQELAEFADGETYREYARDRLHRDGDLEIDDDAAVSLGADNGAYIMCWKWLDHDLMRENGYLENIDAKEQQQQ